MRFLRSERSELFCVDVMCGVLTIAIERLANAKVKTHTCSYTVKAKTAGKAFCLNGQTFRAAVKAPRRGRASKLQSAPAGKPRVAYPAIKRLLIHKSVAMNPTKPFLTPVDAVIKRASEHRKYGFPNLCNSVDCIGRAELVTGGLYGSK